jgi:hypothetical protein
MDEIKNIIPRVIQNISGKRAGQHIKLHHVWEALLPEKERSHAALGGFKDNRLTVHVDSPAWLFAMNLKKKKLLEAIQKEVPELTNIHFKIGKMK